MKTIIIVYLLISCLALISVLKAASYDFPFIVKNTLSMVLGIIICFIPFINLYLVSLLIYDLIKGTYVNHQRKH